MSADQLHADKRLLAAIAYGEASTANDSKEIGGIAFAVANRCRAWGSKTITALKVADPNYAYAWDGSNARFNRLMNASETAITKDTGMSLAIEWATSALSNKGDDPSNGAYWWDGLDFKTNYKNHRKVLDGFKFGDPTHNIFGVRERRREVVIRWKVRNRVTGKIVDSGERGRYDAVWVSTAAHGSTVFWKHPTEYINATGGKAYR